MAGENAYVRDLCARLGIDVRDLDIPFEANDEDAVVQQTRAYYEKLGEQDEPDRNPLGWSDADVQIDEVDEERMM